MKVNDTAAFDTGFEVIDNQHRKLLENINEFFDITSKNSNYEEILRLLKFLQTYVIEHFTDEELLYSKYAISGLDEHKEAHNKIIRELDEILIDIKRNGYSPIIEIKIYNTLIRDMLYQIEKYDKRLIEEINGITAFNKVMNQ